MDRHRVEVVAGHDAGRVGHVGQPLQPCVGDPGEQVLGRRVEVVADSQVERREPPRDLLVGLVGPIRVHRGGDLQRLGAGERRRPVGPDRGRGQGVGQLAQHQRAAVVLGAADPVVPRPPRRRAERRGGRLVDRGEPAGLAVAGQEGLDVTQERIDPRRVGEAPVRGSGTAQVLGQAEVAQVDHDLQAGGLRGGQRPVPQRPVVDAGGHLGARPRHPVAQHGRAGRGHVAAVGVHALQVAAVAELVDPGREHPPAVGVWVVHQRVRGLLARCPDPVGEHHLGGAGCRVGFGVGSQGGLR